MGRLKPEEYFEIYDERLKKEYFKGSYLLFDDRVIRNGLLDLQSLLEDPKTGSECYELKQCFDESYLKLDKFVKNFPEFKRRFWRSCPLLDDPSFGALLFDLKKYFEKSYLVFEDIAIRDGVSDLKECWQDLNTKAPYSEESKPFLKHTAWRIRKDSELGSYVEVGTPDRGDAKDYLNKAEDDLFYCLNNGLYRAVCGPAYYKQRKLSLALMIYAPRHPSSLGFEDNGTFQLIKEGANPHEIIETQMPTVGNKDKEETAKNTPFMYFLERTGQSGVRPLIPSPARRKSFYADCPFTFKNPQGETLFSLFIKRHLYQEAEELLDFMAKDLSPKEITQAINIRRVDAHFKQMENNYFFAIERLLFRKGDTKKAEEVQKSREAMRETQKKIHQFMEENQKTAKKSTKKKSEKKSDPPPKKGIVSKTVELVQATFDF